MEFSIPSTTNVSIFTMKDSIKIAYMKTAELFAEQSHARRLKVGAIIVKENRIISIGYNGMPSGWDNNCEIEETLNDVPHMRKEYADRGYVMHSSADSVIWKKLISKPEVLHAEANAIAKLAQCNESSRGAVLFCTHLPCIECAKLIHQAGIVKVYYRDHYNASKGQGKDFLENSKIQLEKVDTQVNMQYNS